MNFMLLSFAALSATAQHPFVSLPLGTTSLTEIGFYCVAYESYGSLQVDMAPGWIGSDAASGIVYEPNESMLGRPAIMMHSPWRVPVGKTWADYPVHMPSGNPIALQFGITMSPDAMLPGKSDGVTFTVSVVEASEVHELFHEHYAKVGWKDVQLDLSLYAEKDVTIRLQVEPGPAKNPGWDYSYFSEPTIRVGSAEHPAATGDNMLSVPAVKAANGVNFARVSNDPGAGIVPSSLFDSVNAITADGDSNRFTCKGADGEVAYVYTPNSGTLDDFLVTIGDASPFQPALGGGVTATVKKDGQDQTILLRGGSAKNVELTPDGKIVHVLWAYPFGEKVVEVSWRFGICGKALTVEADCTEPVLSGLSLGHEGNVAFRKTIAVPYLLGTISYLSAEHAFACRYLDWTVSHASMCPQGEASYEPKTDGTRNPLYESGYIAVSSNVVEVLPNLPNPPSPYIAETGPRIILDVWQHHKGTYQGDAENLRDLKDNGVDHLAIISHVWQRYGYDEKLPDHIPANPQFGGDEGMKEFGIAANECGYVWALHENYIDMYPDAPCYDPSARALNSDGSPVLGWYNAGSKVQSFGIKCNRAIGFADKNSPQIHKSFGTTAAYLDVHTCVPPWHVLDHDSTQPKAAMAQFKYDKQVELFQYERDTHSGPLFGEGNNQFYWAGRCDGVEGQVSGGEDHVPFLDFDLVKIHPQMVNHGMGYYERWCRRGYEQQWGYDSGSVEQIDKYRAQEIAYGHAGFIGAAQTDNVQWVAKEHHLMHPIQRLMNTAKVTSISYEVNGRMAPVGVAIAADQRFRQHITYDSGLSIWVNWAKAPWIVEGRILPQWGFLALGPDTEVETVLKGDHFADYAVCPEFLFADARTSFNMPYTHAVKDIEPKLKSFEWLGANKVRLAYEWKVNDILDKDYECFVHFVNTQIGTAESIAFQQDHALPKPTSQWKRGETITDGPYDITIPDGNFAEYEITIGLYKDTRVPLKHAEERLNRVPLGTLSVTRKGNDIKNAQFSSSNVNSVDTNEGMADFKAHLNPEGTWVDFETIATDGSVKINRTEHALALYPYPRDKSFTVAINLAQLAGKQVASLETVQISTFAAGTRDELGTVPYSVRDGRIVFTVGKVGAGQYQIRW